MIVMRCKDDHNRDNDDYDDADADNYDDDNDDNYFDDDDDDIDDDDESYRLHVIPSMKLKSCLLIIKLFCMSRTSSNS